jgi:hypothetical protein
MYKVIRTTTWKKNGIETNFYGYVRAENMDDATEMAVNRWGYDNIKEIIEE